MIKALGDKTTAVESRCQEIADFISERWPQTPRAGIILGTGLGELAKQTISDVTISYSEIPHFPRSTALGHHGQLVCGRLNGIPVIALEGRFHLYEGYSSDEITLPVAVLSQLGAEMLLVSNASGGLNPRLRSGDILLIADHLDLMGRRTACLAGSARLPSRSGGRTPYDPELLAAAQDLAWENGFACSRGTYIAVLGPNYETRAEYRAMRRMGGDVVGMSTVPEVLAAIRYGMRVLAMSTVTNVACPDAPVATAAQEVIDIAASAEPKLRKIVMGILDRFFGES